MSPPPVYLSTIYISPYPPISLCIFLSQRMYQMRTTVKAIYTSTFEERYIVFVFCNYYVRDCYVVYVVNFNVNSTIQITIIKDILRNTDLPQQCASVTQQNVINMYFLTKYK